MLTPKETGGRGGVFPSPVAYSALCEAGFASSRPVADQASMALGWKPTAVDTAYPLCDPTHHYLLTIRKTGIEVTVWKQDIELGRYATTAATYAELLTEALTAFAGTAKGYVSRLAVVENALDYTAFYRLSPVVPGLWTMRGLAGSTVHTLLDFSDAADPGADASGNGNGWTLPGAEQSTDTPTTNACTLNPLNAAAGTYGNGLRSWQVPGNDRGCQATFGMTSGKWYFEVSRENGSSDMIGVTDRESTTNHAGFHGGYAYYSDTGNHTINHDNASIGTYGTAYSAGDVVGVAVDMDIGAIWFTVNGVPQNGATYAEMESGDAGNAAATWLPDGRTYYPGCGMYSGAVETMRFAPADLRYAPPAGFLPLCDSSLPEPAVLDPSAHYHVSTFTADGSAQDITLGFDAETEDWLLVLKGLGEQPWYWVNTVCGLDRAIDPASTAGEFGLPTPVTVSGKTVTIPADMLTSGAACSVMVLKAGADTGLDIVKYTGDGATPHMVGHTLGNPPVVIAVFGRSDPSAKSMYWAKGGIGYRYDLSTAGTRATGIWGGVEPTSTQFAVSGTEANCNAVGNTYVAFLFARSDVVSDFSYLGNGLADGTYCGTPLAIERVEFLRGAVAAHWWNNMDTTRNPVNPVDRKLLPHDDAAEQIADTLAMASNGFKVITTATAINAAGEEFFGLGFGKQSKYRNAF